jgi:hypothetical protein
MIENRRVPISLKIVAALFIFGGISALIEVIVAFMHRSLNINFGILGLFIGPGLLALRPGWRTCALILIWIGLIAFPLFAVLVLAYHPPLNISLFGQDIGKAPPEAGLFAAAVAFALTLWSYWVLVRPDVRRLFDYRPPEDQNGAEPGTDGNGPRA